MSSPLSAVPIDRRRRAAAMALGMGALLLVVGVLPWTLPAPVSVRLLATMCGLAGVMFVLAGGGLWRTIRADSRPAPFVAGCGCGHQHDMDAVTVIDEASCPSGGACGTPSSCATCTLRA